MAQTTETLEPIVGNSPKELPVPQFNRDEILEVVQDGIDKGKVELPSGGTKLYKHDIEIKLTGSTRSSIVTIITNFSQNIEKNEYLDSRIAWKLSAGQNIIALYCGISSVKAIYAGIAVPSIGYGGDTEIICLYRGTTSGTTSTSASSLFNALKVMQDNSSATTIETYTETVTEL